MKLSNVVNGKSFMISLLVSYLMFFSFSPHIPLGTVAGQFVHNISVFSVATNVTVAKPGYFVGITVDVGNQGDFAETFNVTVYYRNVTASYEISNTTVPLYADANTTLNFAWDTTGVAEDSYEITANATAVPSETDTSDNSLVTDEEVAITITMVLVDPVPTTANAGGSFTIDVNITDVVDLYSYGIKISFDGTVLEAVNAKEGPFLKPGGSTLFTKIIEFDTIYVVCNLMGAVPGVSGSGTLFNVTFTVLKSGESDLAILPSPDSALISSFFSGLLPIPFTSFDGKFYTTVPAAKFTYTPDPLEYSWLPLVGEAVTFNATASFDPDDPYDPTPGGLVSYEWNFDDETTGTGSIINHTYNEAGSYEVSLNVTDDDGEMHACRSFVLIQSHDIAVIDVNATPTEVAVGETLTINVTVLNKGNIPEYLNVTAYANMQLVQTKRFDYWTPPDPQPKYALLSSQNRTTTLTWVTTGVPVGTYRINVRADLVFQVGGKGEFVSGIEQNPYNNGMVSGDINITAAEKHDLAITNVKVDPTLIELDEWSKIIATLKNKGNADENYNATITIYNETSVVGTKRWSNETILPGTTEPLEYFWLEGTNTAKEGIYNVTVIVVLVNSTTLEEVTDDNPIDNTLSKEEDIHLKPVASFTYSQRLIVDQTIHGKPIIDQTVIFNATASYAPGIPEGTIEKYAWNFGDGTHEINQTDPIATHTYRAHGTFLVTLTVTDDLNLQSSVAKTLSQYNILITNVTFSPHVAASGESVSIDVTVQTRLFQENFTVTTYYNDNEILTQTNTTQPVGNFTTLTFTWDTTGVPGGNYTIKAVAATTGKNMTYIGGLATIQRLPSTISISASQTTFTLGATTTINGTVNPTPSEVDVTIWYRPGGDEIWIELANVTTGADGTYSHPWTPETAGTYAIRSSWQGSNVIMSDESEVQIITVQETTLSPFLYTTVGLAAGIVILAFYFLKIRKPGSK